MIRRLAGKTYGLKENWRVGEEDGRPDLEAWEAVSRGRKNDDDGGFVKKCKRRLQKVRRRRPKECCRGCGELVLAQV